MNVVFIGSDDLNHSLGCYGHSLAKSPNIDRLAAQGTRFDRAYCNFPLCGPSRTSLLSGLRPDSTKIWQNEIAIRDKVPDALTLPQHLRNSGYFSARYGKMYHMGVPTTVGTNKFDDPPSWDVAISPRGLEHKSPGQGRKITPNLGDGGAMAYVELKGNGGDQPDSIATELTLELIDKQRDKPFFVGLGYLRPHVPFVAPERFFDLYPLSKITLKTNPENDRDDIPVASERQIGTRANDMGMNERDKREALRAYYAAVSYMDWNLGRVLDGLEKAKIADRTAIVFWGDHGWHHGEHFRWQKQSLFEESARCR